MPCASEFRSRTEEMYDFLAEIGKRVNSVTVGPSPDWLTVGSRHSRVSLTTSALKLPIGFLGGLLDHLLYVT
jgi:hypothetical protein